jgi:hypothetical protein
MGPAGHLLGFGRRWRATEPPRVMVFSSRGVLRVSSGYAGDLLGA